MSRKLKSSLAIQLLEMKEVLDMTRQSRTAHFDKLNKKSKHYDPDYPKPVKIGFRSVRYIEHEVVAWIEKKMEDRK